MRRYAKAATAGSTQRQAQGLGRFFRGAFAGRGASGHSRGSGAPAAGRLLLPLTLSVALVGLVVGVSGAIALAPTVLSTGVSGVTTSTAVLEAEINPESEVTTYHFEYGPADCSSNPCASEPAPDGNVGSGSTPVKITKELKGLDPGATYHFRVVATNASGPTAGADRTFTTYANPSPGANCPNEQLRTGASALLPDCRAYEMVTPIEKRGADIVSAISVGGAVSLTGFDQSSVLGGKIAYSSYRAFAGAQSAPYTSNYIATRGVEGWTTESISPTRGVSTPTFIPLPSSEFKAFSPDLSTGWLMHNTVDPLTPEAVSGYNNLYARDNLAGSYSAVTILEPPNDSPGEFTPELQGASADGSHVIFRGTDALTPDAPPVLSANSSFLYERFAGGVRLVAILPNGEPSQEASSAGMQNALLAYGTQQTLQHAISDDGSRIFWTAFPQGTAGGAGRIYVRINGTTTVAVSESVSTEPARFLMASASGSAAIFAIGEDLYEFDVDTETPTLIANQVSGVLGASDDVSYVYLVSKAALAAGATAGQPNLYLFHDGTMSFIGTLATSEVSSNKNTISLINPVPIRRLAQVTPDGRHLAFVSAAKLTGYDNTDTVKGTPDPEVYLYDADAEELSCPSCNPSGARPTGGTYVVGGSGGNSGKYFAAAIIPAWRSNLYQARALSDGGDRLFFEAFDSLVPQDTNGVGDVYQWEAQGSGDCTGGGGCVSLLSTGKSTVNSEFVDATPDGDEAFIRTVSSIDPRDPGLFDIYSARIGGGFPYVAPTAPCVGDACQSAPAAPNDPTPASATFRGAGSPVQRKVRRRKCQARRRHAAGGKAAKSKKHTKRCTRNNRRVGR